MHDSPYKPKFRQGEEIRDAMLLAAGKLEWPNDSC